MVVEGEPCLSSRRKQRSGSGASSDAGSVVEVPMIEDVFASEDMHQSEDGGKGMSVKLNSRRGMLDLQSKVAEMFTNSNVEISMGLASFVYMGLIYVQVALALPSSDYNVALWQGFSIASLVFLCVFCVDVCLRIFAFGRSFWRIVSNSLESCIVFVALSLEIVVLGRLFSEDVNVSSNLVTVFNSISKLFLILFRYRRFKHTLTFRYVRETHNSDASSAPDRVLKLLREIRRKYPLTVREAQNVSWASFLIASRKLYSVKNDFGRSDLFEGLDDETTEWLISTYSRAHVEQEGHRTSPPLSPASMSMQVPPFEEIGPSLLLEGEYRVSLNADAASRTSARTSLRSSADMGAFTSAPPTPHPVAEEPEDVDEDHVPAAKEGNLPHTSSTSSMGNLEYTGRHTSGERAGLVISDLPLIREALLREAYAPGFREHGDEILSIKSSDPHSPCSDGGPSGQLEPQESDNNTTDSSEGAGEEQKTNASTQMPPLNIDFGPRKRKKHTRTRTSIAGSMRNGEDGISVEGRAGGLVPEVDGDQLRHLAEEHKRLKQCTWTQGEIDKINCEIDEWAFDVFVANELAAGRPLTMISLCVARKHGVFDFFPALTPENMVRFMTNVENEYRRNPYHTRLHAADVVATVHHFLTHNLLRSALTPLDLFCAIFASGIHDVRHPGLNNAFLVATGHELAVRYNDHAVLEQMHAATAFELMRTKGCDLLKCLGGPERYAEARQTIISMVLATDMSAHFEQLETFKTDVVQYFHNNVAGGASYSDGGTADGVGTESLAGDVETSIPIAVRRSLLNMTLHVADVSNPAKAPKLCQKWATLVQEEFYMQGDLERASGLQISKFMDRRRPAFHKCQIGFIKSIVRPLFATYCEYLTTLRPQVENCLAVNLSHWEQKQREEDLQSASMLPSSTTPPPATIRRAPQRRMSLRFFNPLTRSQTTAGNISLDAAHGSIGVNKRRSKGHFPTLSLNLDSEFHGNQFPSTAPVGPSTPTSARSGHHPSASSGQQSSTFKPPPLMRSATHFL